MRRFVPNEYVTEVFNCEVASGLGVGIFDQG